MSGLAPLVWGGLSMLLLGIAPSILLFFVNRSMRQKEMK
jgi:hypothetical protein